MLYGITYGYDLAGNRTSLTNGSSVTTFVLNPQSSQVLMRIKNSTTNYYIYGRGLVYEIDETSMRTNTAMRFGMNMSVSVDVIPPKRDKTAFPN